MRILLDTHLLLWALSDSPRLPSALRSTLIDPADEVLFSAASIWEIAIKSELGKILLQVHPRELAAAAVATGFVELNVTAVAAAAVADLPDHHRDPFDRLLIAQAITEPARLYTVDPQLPAYSSLVTLF